MLSLEVRRRTGAGAEIHRVIGNGATIGASSGNEVVIRARGVAGRHARVLERSGSWYLDLFKGVEAVNVNGREFSGGPISAGDRITIGEATITVLQATPPMRATPMGDVVIGDNAIAPAPSTLPVTEVEYRALRLGAYRLCRTSRTPEDLATELSDFLDRELPPSEWAVGEFSPLSGFRPLSSTFRETLVLPPRVLQEARAGERLVRTETVTGVLTLILEPLREAAPSFALLVREAPRLAARAILFLEELVQLAGIAFAAGSAPADSSGAPVRQTVEVAVAPPAPEASEAETVLRQSDDLKKIIETVEREVIDRAMRRVEGNQSRGAEILNISRGSLIAKLKEYSIPDYRYLRRERTRRS
jgi:pSer/pThr/pTyr-binding forkhead associated (FHA) protein